MPGAVLHFDHLVPDARGRRPGMSPRTLGRKRPPSVRSARRSEGSRANDGGEEMGARGAARTPAGDGIPARLKSTRRPGASSPGSSRPSSGRMSASHPLSPRRSGVGVRRGVHQWLGMLAVLFAHQRLGGRLLIEDPRAAVSIVSPGVCQHPPHMDRDGHRPSSFARLRVREVPAGPGVLQPHRYFGQVARNQTAENSVHVYRPLRCGR